jgi:hypothetical protein
MLFPSQNGRQADRLAEGPRIERRKIPKERGGFHGNSSDE